MAPFLLICKSCTLLGVLKGFQDENVPKLYAVQPSAGLGPGKGNGKSGGAAVVVVGVAVVGEEVVGSGAGVVVSGAEVVSGADVVGGAVVVGTLLVVIQPHL